MDEPRGRRLGQGGEPWLQWTPPPDDVWTSRPGDVWTSDVEDYTITRPSENEYQLAHAGETIVCESLAEAVLSAEMNRIFEGPPDGR
jgi:hypothetical protein